MLVHHLVNYSVNNLIVLILLETYWVLENCCVNDMMQLGYKHRAGMNRNDCIDLKGLWLCAHQRVGPAVQFDEWR